MRNNDSLPSQAVSSGDSIEGHREKNEPVQTEKQVNTRSEEQTSAPPQEFLHGLRLVAVVSGLTLVMFLAMLDIAIVGTAIPEITSDFHRLGDVGWYVGAYQLSSATIQPLSGKLFAHFNTKRTYIMFFLLFEIGSAICGAAPSSIAFILGRVVSGLGASGLSNGSITIMSTAIVADKRPFYTSITMGIAMMGIVAGPLLGGALTEHASWRWCFYINLPVGAAALVCLVLTKIPDQTRKDSISNRRLGHVFSILDIPGFLLLAPTAVMFLLALQSGSGEYGWASSIVIGLFCGAGVLFLVFLAWEYRKGEDAMIPWQLVCKRVVWSSCLNYGFLMTGIVITGVYTPLFLQSVKGYSPTKSAVYMLPAVLSQLAGVILSGALVVKLRYYIPWAAGGAAINAVAAGLISTWDMGSNKADILCCQLLFVGRGAAIQMGIIALQNSLPLSEIPVASALTIFCQNLFGAIFVVVSSTIFQETLTGEIESNVPSITPQQAIEAGGSAEAVRQLAGANQDTLIGLLSAYTMGFSHVFYLIIGLSIAGFFLAFGMGWVDLKKKTVKKATASRV